MLAADLIVTNANLITLDSEHPRAAAMAVRDGRIVRVGDAAAVNRLADERTRCLDLAGRTVTPGFIDSHIHLLWYGSQLLKQADLVGCADIDEMLGRLSALAGRLKEGWLQGHGFDQSKMREGRFPTRDDLDRVSSTRPIIVSRICGHAAVVNSAALALVDATDRQRGDERAGLYTEDAIAAFYRRIPPLTEPEMEQSVLAASRVALRTGITSVQTMLDTPGQMTGYTRLHRRSALPLRVVGMPMHADVEQLHRHGLRSGFGDQRLKFGACKLFSDGSLGAQTALLSEPYADKPETRGIRMYEPQDLAARCRDAQARGWQVAVHAIGDQALRETIDALEHAVDGQDNRQHRHRVEHASLCPPDCLERLAALKIVVTLQPQFVTSDTWTPQRIGRERTRWAYPFKDLVRAGVPVTLSSDCPVERLDAFACLASAVGGHEWRPGQQLTPEEAIHAYCLGSAYAGFMEKDLGSLQVGKLADFVVLSGDPTQVDACHIPGLMAERVFLGGEEVPRE
jgi:hypothetical protein